MKKRKLMKENIKTGHEHKLFCMKHLAKKNYFSDHVRWKIKDCYFRNNSTRELDQLQVWWWCRLLATVIKDIKLKNCAKNFFEKCKDPPVIFNDLDFSFPFGFFLIRDVFCFFFAFICSFLLYNVATIPLQKFPQQMWGHAAIIIKMRCTVRKTRILPWEQQQLYWLKSNVRSEYLRRKVKVILWCEKRSLRQWIIWIWGIENL